MTNTSKKREQLGMPLGTAQARLRKKILFSFVCTNGLDICFRCGKQIYRIEQLSIEHKEAWLDSNDPIELFFDLDNIAFSHLSCNSSSRKVLHKGNKAPHGTPTRYSNPLKCRCNKCVKAKADYRKERYPTKGRSA